AGQARAVLRGAEPVRAPGLVRPGWSAKGGSSRAGGATRCEAVALRRGGRGLSIELGSKKSRIWVASGHRRWIIAAGEVRRRRVERVLPAGDTHGQRARAGDRLDGVARGCAPVLRAD